MPCPDCNPVANNKEIVVERQVIEGSLVARMANEDPPSYRVLFDDGTGAFEVGSISRRQRHTGQQETYWDWRVDTFPLPTGSPSGEAPTREAAMEAFRPAFLAWVNAMEPGQWEENRDHKRLSARQSKP